MESQNFLDPVLKIQIWVKHNKTLITQNPVLIFQIVPKKLLIFVEKGLVIVETNLICQNLTKIPLYYVHRISINYRKIQASYIEPLSV